MIKGWRDWRNFLWIMFALGLFGVAISTRDLSFWRFVVLVASVGVACASCIGLGELKEARRGIGELEARRDESNHQVS